MNVQLATRKFGGYLSKKSPTILTVFAVAGLIGTVVLASKASIKAAEIVEYERQHMDFDNATIKDGVPPKRVLELTWKLYIPTPIVGLATVSCMVGSNVISARRGAAILGAYKLSETAFREYKDKVLKHVGHQTERVIKDEIAQDRLVANPIGDNEILITQQGETLCYDAISGRYFKSDRNSITQALNKLSRDLMSEHFITLNQVYDELGLKSTSSGENIGWHIDDGLIVPDFSSQLAENGTPCLVLDYEISPRYGYNNY